MTVASSTDRATFPGNDATTVFPLPFRFFANSDIQAWLVTTATGVLTQLTLGVHYMLTGAGDPEVAGNASSELTMITPPTSAQSLFVLRVIPVTQPTDIVNQGRFFPETHETVFDRLTMLIQQNAGAINRVIRVQDFDPEPARLPSAAQRALKIMSFDIDGNPVAIDAASDSSLVLRQDLANDTDPADGAAIIGRAGQVVGSIADLRLLDKTSPSQHAFVTGYYEQGDGGGGPYYLDAADTTSADNGGAIIVAADGARWKLDHKGNVDVRQFGATADDALGAGTDSFAAIQATINYAMDIGVGKVHAPGFYLITDTLVFDTGVYTQPISFLGDGAGTSQIRQSGTDKDVIHWSTTQFLRGCVLKDIQLVSGVTSGHAVKFVFGCTLCWFKNVNIIVQNPVKRIYYADWSAKLISDPMGVYDTIFEGGDLYVSATHSVNGIDIVTHGTTFNENVFRNMRWNGNNFSQHFMRVINTDAINGTYLTNNRIENINFELCKGGGAVIFNARGWTLDGLSFWDVGSAYTNHLVYFAANSGAESTDNTIGRVQRHGDSLAGGVYEVFTEFAQDTTCLGVSPIAGSAYNWNNKRVNVIGHSLRAFSVNMAGYKDSLNWSSAGCTFDSPSGNSLNAYGIASVVRNSAGQYTITLLQPASDAYYQIAMNYEYTGVQGDLMYNTQTTGSFVVLFLNAAGTPVDPGGKISLTVHA